MTRLLQYQVKAEPVLVPAGAAETVTLDKWFVALSEPLRGPRTLPIAARRVLAWHTETPIPEGMAWFQALAEPVRTRRKLPVGAIPSLAWNTETPAPSMDTWFRPLAEQPKAVRLSTAAIASGLYYIGEPIAPAVVPTMDTWYRALSERPRARRSLPIGAYPFWWMDAQAMTVSSVWTVATPETGGWGASTTETGIWTIATPESGGWA